MLAPLRERDFRLLWSGMTVSLIGDGVLLVALAWKVYELSNTPSALAAVGVAMAVPHLAFLLVGGVASDRFDRRRLMIASDAVRGTVVAILGFLALTGTLRLWHVLALVVAFGAATAFFGPAFDALVPDVVSHDRLPQANAIDQFVRPCAYGMVGPAVGGLLIATGGSAAAFLVDAATFAVSIAFLSRVRPLTAAPGLGTTGGGEPGDEQSRVGQSRVGQSGVGQPGVGQPAATGMFGEIREGFRYVRANVWLWATFVAATFAYLLFMGPVDVLLPYLVKNDLHAGAGALGMVLAFGGVGALFGALVVGGMGMPRRSMTFVYVAWACATLAVAGYAVVRLPWHAMVVSFLFSAFEAAGTVVWLTTKQRLVPRALLGRVSSFDWFISTGLVPLSFAITAPVAAAIGARTTLLVAGVVGSAVTLAFLFVPGVRDIEGDEERADMGSTDDSPVGAAA